MFSRGRQILWRPVLICVFMLAGVLRPALADCRVNGGIAVNGTTGDDTILCDNNPSAPSGQPFVAGGAGGDDTITINSDNQAYVSGDANTTSSTIGTVGAAGADTIIINGNTSAFVYGDDVNGGVTPGNDTITINGQAAIVYGDSGAGTVVSGSDTITINGTVTTAVIGDMQTGAGVFTGG